MSKLQVDDIVNKEDTGPAGFSKGAVVTGVATATHFSGNLTGTAVTATSFVGALTGAATGLTGTPDISVKGVNSTGIATAVQFSGNVTGTAGTFSGDVSVRNITGVAATFSGTLSYEDVVNIDSVGIITAQSGVSIADSIFHTGDTNTALRFPAADTFTVETAGSERYRITSGISLFKSGLAEKVNVKSQLTSANTCAITDGNVILTTSAEPGNTYPDITGVHSVLSSGEGFSVTIALKVDGSGTINSFRIDGVAQTIEWSGGSAPSAGSDGYDVFTFSAFKTGSGTTDYKVFGAATNYT